MARALLEINHLSIYFRDGDHSFTAVDDVCFSIERGETLALVGESGSGKTLIALAALQLLPNAARVSAASQIVLSGKNLLNLPEIIFRKIRGRRISMIFQEASTALNPVLTIGDQIEETLKCHFSMSRYTRKKRVLSLLAEVGIPDPMRCVQLYPHMLSGGMRQRAMIAVALAPQPDLLIADEPTTALDVTLQAQILDLLLQIQRKTNMGLLFITHDLGVVYKIADQVVVIAKGKIVEHAGKAEFFAHPQHPYSKRLFEALPSWEKRSHELLSTEDEAKKILIVDQLKVYFPVRKGIFPHTVDYVKAVDGVNFNIHPKETFALVGESGSGKTTVAKAILKLVETTQGRVQFLGRSLTKVSWREMRALRSDLQMIFQDPYFAMNPRMRVGDILVEGMLAQKLANNVSECDSVIDELLVRVHLPKDCKNRFPHEFSGGQRQRICIARALAMRPQLIICDEPTSALDVVVQMEILELLKSLQLELGLSYLLITHNISVVAYLAHRVAVMKAGKIVEQGEVAQVLFHPQEEYTKHLLASVPTI